MNILNCFLCHLILNFFYISRYSKKESLKPGSLELYEFTHLITEGKNKFSNSLKPYIVTHDIIDTIEAFHQLSFNYLTIPPIKIKTKPVLFILKRRDNYKEFLDAVGGKEYAEKKYVTLDSSEESQETEVGDKLSSKTDGKSEHEKFESYVKEELVEQAQQKKTETSTEEIETISETVVQHIKSKDISSENIDDTNLRNQQGINEKIYTTKSTDAKTDTFKILKDKITEENFIETNFLNEVRSDETEENEEETEENKDETEENGEDTEENEEEMVPNVSKKLAGATIDEEAIIEYEEPFVSDEVIEEIRAHKMEKIKPSRTFVDISDKPLKESIRRVKSSIKVPAIANSDENLEKDDVYSNENPAEVTFIDAETIPFKIKKNKIMEKSNKEAALPITERNMKYNIWTQKVKKSMEVSLDSDKPAKKRLKKPRKPVILTEEDNEVVVFTPKPSGVIETAQNRHNVKQTIRKIIQKYKKEIFDKEYYSQPRGIHAKDTIKRIIDEEKIKEEREEISKLEKQIMDLIENNEKIVNKQLIKAKIQETIRTELLNAIDYHVESDSKVNQEDIKTTEAKETAKRKFGKSKIVFSRKISEKVPERVTVLRVDKVTLKTDEEPHVPEDFDVLSQSDEDYATGEQGVPLESPVVSTEDFPELLAVKSSTENDILESEKREFVKKFKKANEKLENIMTIIEEIVDTIEITDEDDPNYLG